MGLVLPAFGLFFWMIVSFSLLLIVLKRFAWKPILNALHDRENSIQEALDAAELARREMEKLQAGNEKILKQAILERETILKEARDMKESIVREAKDEAVAEANKVMESARLAIIQERAAAVTEIRGIISNFSIEIAEKILEEKLSDSQKQKELISHYIDRLTIN